MLKRSIALLLVTVPCAAQANENTVVHPNSVRAPNRPATFFLERYQAVLTDLRQEALATRAADGGSLTPAHRNAIQRKLDQAHFDMIRNIRNNDRLSVDATGVAEY